MSKITQLRLNGTFKIEFQQFYDSRGCFEYTYDHDAFEGSGLNVLWLLEKQSFTKNKNTIRGLHFQEHPFDEIKLVRVVKGKVLDVFVDIRKDSKTYGQWDCIELSEDKSEILYLSSGFAHGFCTLSDDVIFNYKSSNYYSPKSERGIIWNDSDLNVLWPTTNPILSDKDKQWNKFCEM